MPGPKWAEGMTIPDTAPVAKTPRPGRPRKMNIGKPAIHKLEAVEKYSWYIDHAFDFRKRTIAKQLEDARKTVAEPLPADYPANYIAQWNNNRDSLQGMIDHLEWVQREFDEAHEALKAVGIK